jgi:hypothetical protein
LKRKAKQKTTLGEALMKVATGYSVEEVTEEYAEVDGELKLMKRKETKKDVPPDLKAVQLLLASEGGGGMEQLSDEELEAEKARLLSVLQMQTENTGEGVEKTVKKTVKKSSTVKKSGTVKKTVAKKNGRK